MTIRYFAQVQSDADLTDQYLDTFGMPTVFDINGEPVGWEWPDLDGITLDLRPETQTVEFRHPESARVVQVGGATASGIVMVLGPDSVGPLACDLFADIAAVDDGTDDVVGLVEAATRHTLSRLGRPQDDYMANPDVRILA